MACTANVTPRFRSQPRRHGYRVAQIGSDIQIPVKFHTPHVHSFQSVLGAVARRRPLLEPPLSEPGAVADCRRGAGAYGKRVLGKQPEERIGSVGGNWDAGQMADDAEDRVRPDVARLGPR